MHEGRHVFIDLYAAQQQAAVFAAAGIAKSELWSSGWAAVKIGAAGFIVPFMFAYEPALLMIGDWPWIIWRFICASVGILLFAAGLHGYFLTRAVMWERVLLVVGGLLLVKPDLMSDLAGAVIIVIAAGSQYLSRASREQPPVKTAKAS